MDVLSRVIPFFLMIAVGVVASRARLIDMTGARALSAYVFWIAFPALLVHSLANMPRPDAAMAGGLAVYAAAASAPLIVAVLAGRALGWPREQRAGAGMASVVSNTAFLGAPMAVSLFGPSAAGPAAAVVAVDCTLIMALATATLRSAAGLGWRDTVKATVGNPLVIASIVGLILCLTEYRPIGPVNDALALLRSSASPVGLVALGVVVGLEFARPDKGEAAPVLAAVGLKTLLTPAFVYLATGLIHADPGFRAVATLLAACPTAVSVFIQTRTYGVFAKGGAIAVVIATLVTAVSLPLLGAFLATLLP